MGSAHVLGGGEQEFTGRFAYCAERITRGEEISGHAKALSVVFIHCEALGDPRLWVTTAEHRCARRRFQQPARRARPCRDHRHAGRTGARPGLPAGEEASPFAVDRHYAMSNVRAEELGSSFFRTADRLPGAAAEAPTTEPSPTA
ncbi:hypothetical protein ACIRP2_28195 [Streptomyces sp. NPDC101194]|uniref:hypothetical protein n=1 Tax=Streptomyces sp. NPDC101194 TaxID=3366127 RepID=UPI003808B27D